MTVSRYSHDEFSFDPARDSFSVRTVRTGQPVVMATSEPVRDALYLGGVVPGPYTQTAVWREREVFGVRRMVRVTTQLIPCDVDPYRGYICHVPERTSADLLADELHEIARLFPMQRSWRKGYSEIEIRALCAYAQAVYLSWEPDRSHFYVRDWGSGKVFGQSHDSAEMHALALALTDKAWRLPPVEVPLSVKDQRAALTDSPETRGAKDVQRVAGQRSLFA